MVEVPRPESCKLDRSLWHELVEKCKTRSLREVATDYEVSHEAVRRTLTRAAGAITGRVGEVVPNKDPTG